MAGKKEETSLIVGFWRAPVQGRERIAGRLHEGESVALVWNHSEKPGLIYFTNKITHDPKSGKAMRTPSSRPGFTPQGMMGEHEFLVIYDHEKKELLPLTVSMLNNDTTILDHFKDKRSPEALGYVIAADNLYRQFQRMLKTPEGQEALPPKRALVVEYKGRRPKATKVEEAAPEPQPVVAPTPAPVVEPKPEPKPEPVQAAQEVTRRGTQNPTVGQLLGYLTPQERGSSHVHRYLSRALKRFKKHEQG